MAKYKESKMRYGRYMTEDCCPDCDYEYPGGNLIAGCHFTPTHISICPQCGSKLEAVVGRWKYTEEQVGGFFGWFCDTKTTYHGFERGREGQKAKVIHEAQSHINKEVAKWLDECSHYKVPEPGEVCDGAIRWHEIEQEGYPPVPGREYDVYTHDVTYTKVVKVITYDGSGVWLHDDGAEWIFPITHWRLRPAPPK